MCVCLENSMAHHFRKVSELNWEIDTQLFFSPKQKDEK